MKYLFLFLLTLLSIDVMHAQSYVDSSKTRDKLFTKTHAGFELLTGITSGKVITYLGDPSYVEEKPIAATHELNFFLKKHISNKWSFGVKLGLGFFPMPMQFKNDDKYLFEYWDKLAGKAYGLYAIDVEHRFKRHINSYSYWQGGASLMYFENGMTLIGSKTTLGKKDLETYYLFTPMQRLTPLVHLTLGRQHLLRDMNLFGYFIRANYSFNQVYTGRFLVNDRNTFQSTLGTISASGNSLAIGISYTFTGMRKLALSEQYQSQHPNASKKEIKSYLLHKMQESPGVGPWKIAAYAGPTLQPVHVKDPNMYLLKSYAMGFAGNLSASYNLRSTTALELGLGMASYSNFIRPNLPPMNCLVCGSGGDAFTSTQLSLQLVQKLIPKNMLRRMLFAISAGYALGLASNQLGKTGYGNSYFVNETDTVISEKHQNYQVARIIPTAMLGISRPFRISSNLDLNLGYFMHFGWRDIYRSEVSYTASTYPYVSKAMYTIKGGYQQLRLGFVYRLPESKSYAEKMRKHRSFDAHSIPAF